MKEFEFEVDLDARIEDLHSRVRRGGYRPPPVRRVEITGKVMHVFEADIKSYFDTVNHDWLKKMLTHRIADPSLLRLVHRWLRAGVMDGGVVLRTEEGVPQGGPISPVLANVYLHYCLDLWFEKVVKPRCAGYVGLVRYADDFVVCFQFQDDAIRFGRALRGRLCKFGLRVAPEKTRRIWFGRFAKAYLAKYGKKPHEFVFLGFRHICGVDRNGKLMVVRLPSQAALRRFRDRVKTWLWAHMHWKVRHQQKRLASMLRGFYAYFALPNCSSKLLGVHNDAMRWIRQIHQKRMPAALRLLRAATPALRRPRVRRLLQHGAIPSGNRRRTHSCARGQRQCRHRLRQKKLATRRSSQLLLPRRCVTTSATIWTLRLGYPHGPVLVDDCSNRHE